MIPEISFVRLKVVVAALVMVCSASVAVAIDAKRDGSVAIEGASRTAASEQALDATVQHLRARREASADISFERSLAEVLPNQRFSFQGNRPRSRSDSIVFGTVSAVTGGAGYAVDGKDADSGTVVAFDDSDALWKVVEVAVEVSDSIGAPTGSKVRLGLVIDGEIDVSAPREGLLGREIFAPILDEQFFTHDPELWSIAQGGDLLGFVDGEFVSFPVLGASEQQFVSGLRQVESIKRAARVERPVIGVEIDRGLKYSQIN